MTMREFAELKEIATAIQRLTEPEKIAVLQIIECLVNNQKGA